MMILFKIFLALLTIYLIMIPSMIIYIDNETDDFAVKSDKDIFLVTLKLFAMMIPGVAAVKAYKVYKKATADKGELYNE